MRKQKLVLIIFICFVIFSLSHLQINAATFHEDIVSEVTYYVEQGKLPAYHSSLSSDSGYQTYYTKRVRTAKDKEAGLAYLAQQSYQDTLTVITWYRNMTNEVWQDILLNLDIEAQYLDPNKILGLYWDSRISKSFSYMYLVWTTEYLPTEFMTIHDIVINNKKYSQYESNSDSIGKAQWYDSDYYHFPNNNLTIHKTPLGGFEQNKEFGIPLMQKYKVTYINAGIDKKQYLADPDPKGNYNIKFSSSIEFDLGQVPKKDGIKLCQLVTHAYEIIKDGEVQSFFDLGFGGYIHQAVFNTTIQIDKIYRVDVSYTLSSENKSWWQIWLNTKEVFVTKSLTAERVSGGFFNLFSYQGFKEGSFASNIKGSKYYKYKLHLNYDEGCWNIFDNPPYYEADYKMVKQFKILRMNYLADNQVYDVAIKMDTIDGDTLSIVDKELILDTDSILWNVKDQIYEVLEKAKDLFGNASETILIVVSVIISLLLLYGCYKVIMIF